MSEELNKWIAINIMGWELEQDSDLDGDSVILCMVEGDYVYFDPTESISDAWMVLAELYKINGIEITIDINNNEPNYLNIDKYINGETHCMVNCAEFELDKLPMTICLAAKKAWEGKDE